MRTIYNAPCGDLLLEVVGERLTMCRWIDTASLSNSRLSEESLEGEGSKNLNEDYMLLKKTVLQLDEYFAGKRQQFELPLQIEGTPFRKKVWQALMKIPYGEVVTYGELAYRCCCLGGQRAVAQACSANRFPILIPCHRVVKSDGSLGGYTITSTIKKKGTTPQGLDIKRFLIEHESKN